MDRLLIGAFYLTNFLRIDVDLKERDKTASREHHEEGHFVFSLVGGVGFNGFVLELVGPEGGELNVEGKEVPAIFRPLP